MAKVVIDEKVRHGKPVLEGTRITVDEILSMLEAGMSYETITKEYGIKREDILAAIHYAASFVRGEEIHALA